MMFPDSKHEMIHQQSGHPALPVMQGWEGCTLQACAEGTKAGVFHSTFMMVRAGANICTCFGVLDRCSANARPPSQSQASGYQLGLSLAAAGLTDADVGPVLRP